MRAALALLFALYVRAVAFAPVYDDNFISPWDNGWRDIPKFFTHDIFGSDAGASSVYYRPMSMTWGCLVSLLTGGAPGWLHLSAIFLHLTVVLLAFVFGRHLFRDERLALLTAVLFGLHPTKVESVAWIGSSCCDGLVAVFFFASMIAFLKWREKLRETPPEDTRESASASRSWPWQAASVTLFAAALFTKETMICIPILIAVYLWLNGGEQDASRQNPSNAEPVHAPPSLVCRAAEVLRALWPYAAVWTIYAAIRHQVIKPAPSSASYIHPTFTLSNVWTAPYAIWWYLKHLAMPWGLAVEYAGTVIERPTLRAFAIPAIGVVALLAASFWLWRRQRSPVAGFLGAWFVVNLAPPVIVAPMVLQHDRYLYLSCYAFCALLAWAILRLGNLPARARLAIALSVVALWSGLTWHEMSYWDSDTSLWGRVLQISPSNLKAQVSLAFLIKDTGDTARALGVLDDGLRYHPDSPTLWMARGFLLLDQPEQSRAAFLKVMQVTEPPPGQAVPEGPRAKLRATTAYQLALQANASRQFVQGEHYARIALELRNDGAGYHAALSRSLQGEGRTEEADRENATELRLHIGAAAAGKPYASKAAVR